MNFKKGEFVKSPVTGRSIVIGGKVYKKLQKQGHFQEGYEDENILHEYDANSNTEIMKNKIEELNNTLPKNQQAVRGRGKYKNKIVKRYRKPSKRRPVKRQPTILSEERKQARELLDALQQLDADGDIEGQLATLIKQQSQPQEEDDEDDEDDYEDTEDDSEDDDDYY